MLVQCLEGSRDTFKARRIRGGGHERRACRRRDRGTRPLPLSATTVDLSGIRRDKVLSVRRCLAEGRYDLDARLDAVLVKVLQAVAM
jgi:hypothetical protein